MFRPVLLDTELVDFLKKNWFNSIKIIVLINSITRRVNHHRLFPPPLSFLKEPNLTSSTAIIVYLIIVVVVVVVVEPEFSTIFQINQSALIFTNYQQESTWLVSTRVWPSFQLTAQDKRGHVPAVFTRAPWMRNLHFTFWDTPIKNNRPFFN